MNILDVSNPEIVLKNARKYLGRDVEIGLSTRKDKKYTVYNPQTKKWVHFGNINFSDFTKHQDEERRENYLKRSAGIKGRWKDDPFSPNNLSRNILW